MPLLDERHDFSHPVEGDQAWSESYYFNAYDPVSDSGFFTRIGVRPNEGTMDVGLSVWLPGGDLAHLASVRECHEMTDSDLAVGGVRYERVEAMRAWRIANIAATAHSSAIQVSVERPANGARVKPTKSRDISFSLTQAPRDSR